MKYKSSCGLTTRLRLALFFLALLTCSLSFFLLTYKPPTFGECVILQQNSPNMDTDTLNLKRSPNWDYFDEIYCIHSHSAVEREPYIHDAFDKLHLSDDIHWWDAAIDKDNGHRGAWNAHRGVAKHAADNNYTKILIFEDDILIDPILQQGVDNVLQRVVNFLTHTPNWEVFFFSHNTRKIELTPNPDFVRVHSWGALAYALHLDGISLLAQSSYTKGQTVDQLLFENKNAYAIYPMVIEHKPNLSYTVNENRTNAVNVQWRSEEIVLHKDALIRNMFACSNPFIKWFGQLTYEPVIIRD